MGWQVLERVRRLSSAWCKRIGLRQGGTLGLKWPDKDLDRAASRIRRDHETNQGR